MSKSRHFQSDEVDLLLRNAELRDELDRYLDNLIAQSSLGPIGLANGFEWGRTRTATRLRGNVARQPGATCGP